MKTIKLLVTVFFSIAVVSCGGGSASPAASNSTVAPGVWDQGTWDHIDWQ